jgi:ABC-2 type transport system permease protein
MKTLSLAKREVSAYFHTSSGYGIAAIFLALLGFGFWRMVDSLAHFPASALRPATMLFGTQLYWLAMLAMPPMLTMRLFAEERKTDTLSLLLSAPVSSGEIVLGKFLGIYSIFLVLWLPTLAYSWVLRRFASSAAVDLAPLAAGYLVTALVGAFFLSVGLFASLCSRHQLVAGLLCVSATGAIFYFGLPRHAFPAFDAFSAARHVADFARGAVDTRVVVWYFTSTGLMLSLSVLLLEYRRLS